MAFKKYNLLDLWKAKLDWPVLASDEVIQIKNVENIPDSNFTLTLRRVDWEWNILQNERIYVATRTWNTLSWVVRGYANSTAKAWLNNDDVLHNIIAEHIIDIQTELENKVWAAQTATLTNKTFNLASNTLTWTKALFNAALSDWDFLFSGDSYTKTEADNKYVKLSWWNTIFNDQIIKWQILQNHTWAAFWNEQSVKNPADNGGVKWTNYVDSNWQVIGPRKWSLWGYPLKTSDGSLGGYEEFFTLSFPTYDWNISYSKLIEFNANQFHFKNWYVWIWTTNPLNPFVVAYWENNWEISARIWRVSFLWENTGWLAWGISSEWNWFWLWLYSPSGSLKAYVWWKTTWNKVLEITTWAFIYGTEWQTEFFYWQRNTLLSSQVDMWYRFRDSVWNELFRIRTAANDVCVGRNMKFRKDIDTGGDNNTMTIASRYELSWITHANQWHKMQVLWGDLNNNAESAISDWGWWFMFWSNSYKFLELIHIAGSNRVFVWNHNQNNCFVIRWDANDTNAHNLLNGEPNKTMIVTQSWNQVFFYWKDYNGSKWKATVTGSAF